jgi:diketogulonate reductase-like aldo/keto reductase
MPALELKSYCESEGIHLQAYAPLGKGGNSLLFKDTHIISLASRYGVTPAQIVLAWASQRGTSALPKSSNAGRLKENITLPTLTEEEVESITDIHKEDPSKHTTLFHDSAKKDKDGKFLGMFPSEEWCKKVCKFRSGLLYELTLAIDGMGCRSLLGTSSRKNI